MKILSSFKENETRINYIQYSFKEYQQFCWGMYSLYEIGKVYRFISDKDDISSINAKLRIIFSIL